MLIKMICPRCGASMEIDEKQETFTCSHCGYQEVNVAEKIEVTHRVDRSNEPNLYISYHTSNPAVHMVTRIVSTGQKNTYVDGQEMSFHLPAGEQVIVLKIGKKNYNRKVVIPPDNQPVRISASFSGRATIGIDQPPVTGGIARGNAAGGGASGAPSGKKRPSGLSIAAFVLSLTFFLSPLAVLLGALDLFLSKKKPDERHHHGMSVAAVIIGLILTVIMISTRISSCNRERERKREYEQFQKEQSEAAETENESLEARMDTLRWPKGELGDKVPKPDSERGFVEWENASGFYLYIGGMDEAAFRDYADMLYDSGFKVNYSRGDTYYRADNADGDHVSIDYKGDGIVSLRADRKQEEKTEALSSSEDTETAEAAKTENLTGDTEEVGVTEAASDQETDMDAEEETTEPAVPETEMTDFSDIEEKTSEMPITESKDVYDVGDEISDSGFRIVYISSGEYHEENEFLQPEEGNKYIFLKFAFINESNTEKNISLFDYTAYADGYQCEDYYSGEEGLSATLTPGRSTEGYLYYEVPADASNIEVEYNADIWTSRKIKFKYDGEQDSGYVLQKTTKRTDGAHAVGETVEGNGVKITYLTCEDTVSDNMFIQPREGYHFVTLTFEFENTGSSDHTASSLFFDCFADGIACKQAFFLDDDLSGTISAGRKLKGTVTFEVPNDATVIEAEYNDSFWISNRIVFTAR